MDAYTQCWYFLHLSVAIYIQVVDASAFLTLRRLCGTVVSAPYYFARAVAAVVAVVAVVVVVVVVVMVVVVVVVAVVVALQLQQRHQLLLPSQLRGPTANNNDDHSDFDESYVQSSLVSLHACQLVYRSIHLLALRVWLSACSA